MHSKKKLARCINNCIAVYEYAKTWFLRIETISNFGKLVYLLYNYIAMFIVTITIISI